MERRPKPDIDTVRDAMREHDQREAEDEDEAERDDEAQPEADEAEGES